MPALVIKNASSGTTNGKAQTLRIDKLQIQITAIGNTAQTTMEMTFYNDTYQTLEGELFFPLAEGQTISRFAMEIDGHLREGVVVEKNKGRKIFEDIVRRGIDPALLEYTKGNAFRTRVYPINPKSYKRIVIAYKEILSLDNQGFTYNLPLSYPTQMRKFMLRIETDKTVKFAENSLIKNTYTGTVFETEKLNFTPNQPLKFTVPKTDKNEVLAVGNGIIHPENTYFYVHLQPEIFKQAKPLPKKIVLLYDISNSAKNRNLKREISILQNYITSLQNVDIQLITFNNEIRSNKNFSIKNGDFAALKTELATQNFDGGTQLGCLDLSKYQTDEFLLVSDGVSNFGKHEIAPPQPSPTGEGVKTPPVGGWGAIYTINSSPVAEHSYLRFLAETSGGAYLNLTNLTDTQAKNLLLNSPYQFIKYEIAPPQPSPTGEGVKTPPVGGGGLNIVPSKPTTITNDFVIAGKIANKQITNNINLKLHFGFGNTIKYTKTVTIKSPLTQPPTGGVFTPSPVGEGWGGAISPPQGGGGLENLWASLKINELDLQFKTNEKEIATLSTDFSVVSRNTSMLVLDRLEDYKTYHIKPPAALLAQYPDLKWQEEKPKTAKRIVPKTVIREFIEHKKWYNQTFTYTKEDDETISKIPEQNLSEEEKAMGFGESDDGWGDDPFGGGGDGATLPKSVQFSPSEPVPDEEVVITTTIQGDFNAVADVIIDEQPTLEIKATIPPSPSPKPEKKSEVTLKPYVANTYYLRKLDSVSSEKYYETYLQLKTTYEGNIAFYSDVALWFLAKKDTATAILVASNLAEMQLENHEVLRLLASIIKQCKQTQLTVDIYKDVLEIREEEPQSFRDLGLAYAENKEKEKAIETLNEVLLQEWDSRFNGIKSLAINELNNIISKDVILQKDYILQQKKLDKRIMYPMFYDLRVVLEWDNDAYNMDLQVTQPNGEVCSKGGIQTTKNGGKISQSNLPEEFLLRNAMSGNYAINIDYQGSTSQKLPAPVNVTVSIFTNYGRENQKLEQISLRLDKNKRFIRVGNILFEKDSTNESPLTPEGGIYAIRPTTPPSGAGGLTSGTDGLLFSPDSQHLIAQTGQEISFFDLAKKTITKTLAVPNEFYLNDTTKVRFEFKNLHFITDSTKNYKLLVKMDSIIEYLGTAQESKRHWGVSNNVLTTFSFLKVYDAEKLTVLQSQLLHSEIAVKHTIKETDENGNPDSKNSTYNEWKYEEIGKPFELCKQKNAIWQANKIIQIADNKLLVDFSSLQNTKFFQANPSFLPEAVLFDCYEKDSTEKIINSYLTLYDYNGKLLKTIRHNLPINIEKVLQYGKEACWIFGYNEEKSQTELYFYTWEKDNEIFREINIVPENESVEWISEDGKYLVTRAGAQISYTGIGFIARLYDTQTKQLIYQSVKSDFLLSPDNKLFVQDINSELVGREIRIREMDKLPKFTAGSFIAKANSLSSHTPVFDVFENECTYIKNGEIFTNSEFPLPNTKKPVFKLPLPNDGIKDLQVYQKGKGKNAAKAFVALNFPFSEPTGVMQNGVGLYVYAQQNATELENWSKHYDFASFYASTTNYTSIQDKFVISCKGRYIIFVEDSSFTETINYQTNNKNQLLIKVLDTDILEQRHTKYKDIKSFEFYNYVAVKVVTDTILPKANFSSLAISSDEENLAFVINSQLYHIDLTTKSYKVSKNLVKFEKISSNLLFDKKGILWFFENENLIKYDIANNLQLTDNQLNSIANTESNKIIALSNDEKTLAVALGNELQLYNTQNLSSFTSYFDQRTFHKIRFAAGDKYVITSSKPQTQYGDYYDLGANIKAWEAPQPPTGGVFTPSPVGEGWGRATSPPSGVRGLDVGLFDYLYDDIEDYSEGLARIEKGGLFGFIDTLENIVIPMQYQKAENFKNGVAKVTKDNKLGIIDKTGKVILPFDYDAITQTEVNTFIVKKGDKYGLFDRQGKELIAMQYADLDHLVDNLYRFRSLYLDDSKNERISNYGVINSSGKILLENYQAVDNFMNGLAIVAINGKGFTNIWGAINRKGEIIIKPQYLDFKNFNNKKNPFFKVSTEITKGKKTEKLFGVIDSLGKIILPLEYEYIGEFNKGISMIKKRNSYGLIDSTMKIILEPDYQWLGNLQDNFMWVQKNNLYGFADITGKIVIPIIYEKVTDFDKGTALVKQNKHWYRIDQSSKKIIAKQKKYESIFPFTNGLAIVWENKKYGLIDKTGTEIVVPIYQQIGTYKNGLALVKYEKFGFINPQGQEIIDTKYDELNEFSEGLARFRRDTIRGYLDNLGNEIIKSVDFKEYNNFKNGLAKIKKDDKYGFINKTGKTVVAFVYDEIREFSEGIAAAQINGKWIFIDALGNKIMKAEFDVVEDFLGGLAKVNSGGKWYFVDKTGNCRLYCE